MVRGSIFEVKILNCSYSSCVPLQTARRSNHILVLATLILSNFNVPPPNKCIFWIHLDDNVVTEVAAGDVHVLAGIVAADNWGSGAAGAGHHERVVDAVSYQRSIGGGAGNAGGGTTTSKRRCQLKSSEVKSNLTDERIAFADGVSA